MDRYSLEELSRLFVSHMEDVNKHREEMIIRWKNEYSSDKVPEHMEDTFNLPGALLFMVQEIERLRNRLEVLEKSLTRVK